MLNNRLKIIQITDCHLFKYSNQMLDVETNDTFEQVIQYIKEYDLYDTDAIFLTGDLSQDESRESYQRIVDALGPMNKNIYWIPGNHDCIENLFSVFKNHSLFINVPLLKTTHWDFIFLNTKLEEKEYGFLSDVEFKYLQQSLNISTGKSIGIIMHHPPVAVGTPMIDTSMLQNANRFWEVITSYPVKLIMCGHVHGDYSIRYSQNISIEASPSTCIQWVKGAITPAFQKRIGYKLYFFENNTYASETKIWDI